MPLFMRHFELPGSGGIGSGSCRILWSMRAPAKNILPSHLPHGKTAA